MASVPKALRHGGQNGRETVTFVAVTGKPLKGLKRAAAELMYDNRHLTEEELHRLEQSLSTRQGASSAAGGRDCGSAKGVLHRLPVLPDMFGLVSTLSSRGRTVEVDGGDGGDAKYTLPAMNRWFLVQRSHATLGRQTECSDVERRGNDHSVHVGTAGYRWARADALQVEGCLTGSLLAAATPPASAMGASTAGNEMGDGPTNLKGAREELSESWISQVCVSTPAEVELSAVGAHLPSDPFAFFTFSREEFDTLNLGSAPFQPLFLSHESHAGNVSPYLFDYDSTMKLFTLYERFGNFVLVADRWSYTNALGTGPIEVNAGDSKASVPPPIEALMERYKLVSEAVLQHRQHLLMLALGDGKNSGCEAPVSVGYQHRKSERGTSREGAGTTSEKNADGHVMASSHPLVSLMARHPVLEARQRRQEWLKQRFREVGHNDANSDGRVGGKPTKKKEASSEQHGTPEAASESTMLDCHRRDYLRALLVPGAAASPHHVNSSQEDSNTKDSTHKTPGTVGGDSGVKDTFFPAFPSMVSPAAVPVPTPSPFWYDGLLEHARRQNLRDDMIRESRENVPYHMAMMFLQQTGKQAKVLLDRLRTLTRGATTPATEEPDDRDDGGTSDRGAAPSEGVPAEVEKSKGVKLRRSAQSRQRKKRPQQQSADPNWEDSYQAVQEEVRRVPAVCERLRLCVQAGWFLPPSYLREGCEPGFRSGNSNANNEGPAGGRGAAGGGGSNATNIIANRALSNSSESLLLSLPPNTPRIHLSVEHELEKHLWEDHRALCDDSAEVQQLLGEVRVLYTQNVILRRFAGRCGALKASLKKLASDASSKM